MPEPWPAWIEPGARTRHDHWRRALAVLDTHPLVSPSWLPGKG
jgi:hypothetical protein